MTPQPVASTPKNIAPQPAAPPVPAIAAAFDELLSMGFLPLTQGAAQAGKADTAPPTARPKSSSDDDKKTPASAAVPVPVPQLLPTITVVTSGGETKVAAPATTAKAADALALVGNAATPNGSGDAAKAGNGAKLPPGAAELEARIVAGAPTYMSQPNAALAGLWHHMGDATKPGTGAHANDPASANGETAAEGTTPVQAQNPQQAKDLAALAKDTALQQAQASAGPASAEAATAETTKPTVAAAVDASSAPMIPLPTGGDASLAATQATAANAAPPSPTQIPTAWEQVAVNLRQAAQSGNDRIEIQLKPASLGAISVKLDVTHDGHVTAVISADRSDTLNLLRQDSNALAQSLRDAGLQTDSGSLSFNLRGDPQSFAQTSTPAGNSSTSQTNDPTTTTTLRAEMTRYRQYAGALDIEV